MKLVNHFISQQPGIITVVSMLMVSAVLQSCATNPTNDNLPNQAYGTTPSIQKQSYMYRSPPPGALQARGLAR